MNHWQNMSKEIPSRYQVGRYGGLIYPWPRQHLLADPPEHLMLPPRQTGQNLVPSCISHQTHHFFAFVTVTACISSARMLSVVLLDYDTPLAVTDSFQSCAALSMTMAILSIKSVMPSSHLILGHLLLLLPPISPSITVFSNESTLHMRWPKY